MGNYNSQYRSYYENMSSNRKRDNMYRGIANNNRFINRIKVDLAGVLVLCGIVAICKIIVVPQTQAVYNYSKEAVNEKFDYKNIIVNLRNINSTDIKDIVPSSVDKFFEKLNFDNMKL